MQVMSQAGKTKGKEILPTAPVYYFEFCYRVCRAGEQRAVQEP